MESIADRFRRVFAERRTRTALLDPEGTSLSYDDLDEAASRVATALLAGGVKPGDRVVVMVPNSFAAVISYVGVWKMGGVTVGINAAYTVPETEGIVEHSSPTGAIVTTSRMDDFRQLREDLRANLRVVITDDDIKSLPTGDRWPTSEATDEALMIYTSGATGKPKGIMIPHRGALWGAEATRRSHGITETDVMLGAAPLFHLHGLVLHLMQSLCTGNPLVMVNGMDVHRLMKIITEHKVTVWKAVPAVLDALVNVRWHDTYNTSSLKLVTCGTAPSNPEAVQKAIERLGSPTFREAYGASEVSGMVLFGPLDQPFRGDRVGKPVADVTLEIRDPETGAALGPNQEGELWVKTPGLMKGYYRDPELTQKVIRDGWYKSSDVAFMDEEGWVKIASRLSDVIFVGGSNVYPSEIEAALRTFDAIADAAVVAMKHPATGEAPAAFVVPKPGHTVGIPELFAHLRSRLAPHKVPRKIETVDALPRNALGKVVKQLLVDKTTKPL